MTLTVRAVSLTDLGLRRSNNEDSAHVGPRLLAIADGMGGLPAGELASELAIRALVEATGAATTQAAAGAAAADTATAAAGAAGPRPAAWAATDALIAGFRAANERIRAAAAEDPAREGMGTTLTALLFAGDRVVLAHVGDSRCYLLRAGTLTQLTADDTFVQALVDRGVLTPAEARTHPQRSLVTRAMRGDPVDPAGDTLDALAGDRFLLCSDGLSDVVPAEDIAETLRSYAEPSTCAARLVELALAGGGPDNVTVILADVVADGGQPVSV
ncbi:MAG TPA: protein phosphatase 2C domain-containing protein [Pilimelia sp.]|nr:protein phosphatase 2C domain-containing protein [Pilimelia sp.]